MVSYLPDNEFAFRPAGGHGMQVLRARSAEPMNFFRLRPRFFPLPGQVSSPPHRRRNGRNGTAPGTAVRRRRRFRIACPRPFRHAPRNHGGRAVKRAVCAAPQNPCPGSADVSGRLLHALCAPSGHPGPHCRRRMPAPGCGPARSAATFRPTASGLRRPPPSSATYNRPLQPCRRRPWR